MQERHVSLGSYLNATDDEAVEIVRWFASPLGRIEAMWDAPVYCLPEEIACLLSDWLDALATDPALAPEYLPPDPGEGFRRLDLGHLLKLLPPPGQRREDTLRPLLRVIATGELPTEAGTVHVRLNRAVPAKDPAQASFDRLIAGLESIPPEPQLKQAMDDLGIPRGRLRALRGNSPDPRLHTRGRPAKK